MRWTCRLTLVAVVAVMVWDLSRPPDRQWSTTAALAGIHAYQAHLSGYPGKFGAHCRFTPSCSHYAEEVFRREGFAKGGWRAFTRILRCGPWTPAGTVDRPY